MYKCQCGCEKGIPYDVRHKYRSPRFLAGHHIKGDKNPMKRPENRKKISDIQRTDRNYMKDRKGKLHHFFGRYGEDSPGWKGKNCMDKYHKIARDKFGLLGPGRDNVYKYGVIHHMDRDESNNEWDNLMLLSRADHFKLHMLENGGSYKSGYGCDDV